MKKVYVAGAYSANNVCGVLKNMRKGMRLATEVLLAGYAPYVPWFDYHFELQCREGEEIPLQTYYDYSIEWLKVSDAVLLVPGWEESNGTIEEIKKARELGIPVYDSLDKLGQELSGAQGF